MKLTATLLILTLLTFTAKANVPICSPKVNYGLVKWYSVMPRSREIRFRLNEGLTEASNSSTDEYSYPIDLGGKTNAEKDFNKVMYESSLEMIITAFTTRSQLAVQTQDCLNPSPLPTVSFLVGLSIF